MKPRGSSGGARRGRPRAEPDLFGPTAPAAPPPAEPRYDRRARSRSTTPGASPESAVSVETLTTAARDLLEGAVAPLWVRGEVSDFTAHRNGHWYFALRDASSQVRCVVWSRERFRIPAPPDEGMQVAAFGQLTVYPQRGDMRLAVTRLEAQGDGLWRKALELTVARLRAEGLLAPERKRRLPRMPRRVAVVTSPDGAALRDIIAVVRRRCPLAEIVVVGARVQGDGAPLELARAIERVSRWRDADVVIVGRGGGSREDLWAFNDERVARALAACPVPTISAVGHEVDLTVCDLVADVRAPTPSAAAEAAVPVVEDLRVALGSLRERLRASLERRALVARRHLEHSARDLRVVADRSLERRQRRLESAAARLNALSPLATLARGYAIATGMDGRTLSRAAEFEADMPFTLTLRDGEIDARRVERDSAVGTRHSTEDAGHRMPDADAEAGLSKAASAVPSPASRAGPT
jgi:exodeoxyribonuclease VII large subunit